jgi:hypothetical protein
MTWQPNHHDYDRVKRFQCDYPNIVFALNFGGYDRYGLKGLDNISCDVDIGCQGDYSSFSLNILNFVISGLTIWMSIPYLAIKA